MRTHKSEYFCGNKISSYGLEHGYVDYRTLSKAFDAVLNNNIMEKTGWEYWELESGMINNYEEIEELKEKKEELEEKYNAAEYQSEEEKELGKQIEEIDDRILELEEEEQESYYPECYQYYIVSNPGAELLKEYDFIVWYNEELDMYVWGVTHWGTSWDYVLTNIKLELND